MLDTAVDALKRTELCVQATDEESSLFTMGLISPKPKPPRTSGDQLLLCALQALRRRTAYHDIADAQAGAAAAYR